MDGSSDARIGPDALKVLYVAFADADQHGVHRKLHEQVCAMQAAGVNVESLVFVDANTPRTGEETALTIVPLPGGGFDQASRVAAINHCLHVTERFAPDVVYMRYPVYEGEVLRFVRQAPPVVFEVQTIYEHEAPDAMAMIESQWAARILPRAGGIVAVTPEILAHERNRAGVRIPGFVLSNGADPLSIPFVTPALDAHEINLLSVATVQMWHGLDRVIVGMAAEPDVDNVHLHVVGDGPAVAGLRALSEEAALSTRVHFHGRVRPDALQPWYRRTHVAVGCLAAHRKGLSEVAALKHREYALSGLPMILGGLDTDFPATLPWVRQFGADDSPISPRTLRAFALAWTHAARRAQIRSWAEGHVSWDAKMPGLLAFLQTCVAQGERVHQVA
jgi:glycosyltransferase involved in cell wall biosynthesis